MWVRFDGNIFGLNRDLYLGIIYIRAKQTAEKREILFEQLEEDIFKYRSLGNIVLTGDFNGRTGTEPDFIMNDGPTSNNDLPLPEFYENDIPINRNNRDVVFNSYGNCLLEVCKNHGLRILNGRSVGDSFGCFTYYSQYKGKQCESCVGYTITDMSTVLVCGVCIN